MLPLKNENSKKEIYKTETWKRILVSECCMENCEGEIQNSESQGIKYFHVYSEIINRGDHIELKRNHQQSEKTTNTMKENTWEYLIRGNMKKIWGMPTTQ